MRRTNTKIYRHVPPPPSRLAGLTFGQRMQIPAYAKAFYRAVAERLVWARPGA
jgi:hypothetical protein